MDASKASKSRSERARAWAFALILPLFFVGSPVHGQTFDAMRAFAALEKQVAFGPRVPNTEGHPVCRDWLLAELKKSSKDVQRQDFLYSIPGGAGLRMCNIIAQFNPTAKKQILLCAHWDTRPTADQEAQQEQKRLPIPGANDGASGVAVLLEIARTLAAKPLPATVGVQIILFDGEDYGPHDNRMYLGAKHYARNPLLPKPEYGILLDMIGDKELNIVRESYSEATAPEINDKVWRAASALGSKAFRDETGQNITDDHLPLQELGWKVIDLIDFDYPYWHTLNDSPDKCSPASLKAVGDVLLRLLYAES